MLQNKLQQVYILVRLPLVIVPVINLFPLAPSIYFIACSLKMQMDSLNIPLTAGMTLNRLSRWLSGKESACQCRRCKKCGFGPLEDPLNKMATYSSILAWKIPRAEKPDRLQSMGSQRVRNN